MENRADDSDVSFILKCSLCGLCRETCPETLDISRMVRQARQYLIDSGFSDAEVYRPLWVDHDWNAFRLFRHNHGLEEFYQTLTKEKCEDLFFPGCLLANEGPSLVKSVVDWLGRSGKTVGVSVECCGAPLGQIGLAQREEGYGRELWHSLAITGARRIVTACPTCQSQLAALDPDSDIEVVSLFQIMAESGLTAPVQGDGTVTVHDSCTDRAGEIGTYIRKLLSDYEIREMAHHGSDTICCGSGGIVSFVDPEVCDCRAEKRLEEMADTGANLCVTYCMSCAHRLTGRPGREIRHILELLIESPVDHEEYDEKSAAMWEEENGEENFYRLQTSNLKVFSN
jgi:fumarate reductase (CoM/CoB) subunit B